MSPNPTTASTPPSPNPSQAEPVIRERKISNINAIRVWDEEQHGHGGDKHHPEKHLHVQEKQTHSQAEKQVHPHDHSEGKKPKVRKSAQFLSAAAANMGAFTLGTVMAWSATALPSLRASDPTLSKSEEAWIGSIVTLSAAAACPLAAYAMTAYGRRRSMLWLTLPAVAGWLCIAFAHMLPFGTVHAIYGGRAVTGLAAGSFSVVSPIFISETSHVSLRGALASGFDLMLSAGMLYIYVIGSFASWEVQALACSAVPLVVHGLLLLVAESPLYLVQAGRLKEAGEAIGWLFGYGQAEAAHELGVLQKSALDSASKPINFDRVVLKLSVLKPCLICFTVMFFYTMCAYDAVIFYTVDIFKSTGSELNPQECAVLLGAVQVVATLPAALLVERYGRRILLLASELLLALSLLAMGLYFHSLQEVPSLSFLPLLSLTTFLVGYSIGIGPLSLVILSELVPGHLKGAVTCGSLVIRWLLGFAVTNLFDSMQTSLGVDATYWLFGSVCAAGVVWVYWAVPETRGKSLDEIQGGFRSKSKSVIAEK